MIFLLPPSETKRDGGGVDSRLELAALSFPALSRQRQKAVKAVVDLSSDFDQAMTALKLGPRLRSEVVRNRTLLASPTMPALARYTGVVFDPIQALALDDDAWAWADRHVAVHSALFGLVGARDRLPAYRLSHDSRLPGLPLRPLWRVPVAEVLASLGTPVVDLRSEGYADLGPAPSGSAYVRVVSDAGGRRRALNHFNKKTKGTLVARLLASRPELATIDDFVTWAAGEGMTVEVDGRELHLVSESVLAG